MKHLALSVAAALFVSLTALAAAKPLASDGTGCGGCAFLNTPSPPNPSNLPNVCGTDLRVIVAGIGGQCQSTADGCVQSSGCISAVIVEYKSKCAVTLERFSAGAKPDFVIKAPAPDVPLDWTTIYGPEIRLLDCGSPAVLGYYKLTDSSGFFITNSYFYRCTECE